MKYYVVDKSDREDLPFMSNSFEMCTDGKDQFDWFGMITLNWLYHLIHMKML